MTKYYIMVSHNVSKNKKKPMEGDLTPTSPLVNATELYSRIVHIMPVIVSSRQTGLWSSYGPFTLISCSKKST